MKERKYSADFILKFWDVKSYLSKKTNVLFGYPMEDMYVEFEKKHGRSIPSIFDIDRDLLFSVDRLISSDRCRRLSFLVLKELLWYFPNERFFKNILDNPKNSEFHTNAIFTLDSVISSSIGSTEFGYACCAFREYCYSDINTDIHRLFSYAVRATSPNMLEYQRLLIDWIV